jgi:hypothetical protein
MDNYESDDNSEEITVEERVYRSSLETLDYEIGKNLSQIEEWKEIAARQPGSAANCQRFISDAEQRVAQLQQRYFEVEEQEERFRNGEDD